MGQVHTEFLERERMFVCLCVMPVLEPYFRMVESIAG